MTIRIILLTLLILPILVSGQESSVKVSLKDSSIVEGKLLKISIEGVELNPGGNVKFRFISADRIKNVLFIDINKTIEYPLVLDSLPDDLKELDETSTYNQQNGGFPDFLALINFGYGSITGNYYTGYNSGLQYKIGLHYYFHDPNPRSSRFLLGFSYNNYSISGPKIYGYETNLSLSEYSFEFGRTTNLLGKANYLYFLMGFVIVSNTVSASIPSTVTANQTKIALRMEGSASINIVEKLSFLISVGSDIVMGSNEKSKTTYYDYNEPAIKFEGLILNLSLGFTYGF